MQCVTAGDVIIYTMCIDNLVEGNYIIKKNNVYWAVDNTKAQFRYTEQQQLQKHPFLSWYYNNGSVCWKSK